MENTIEKMPLMETVFPFNRLPEDLRWVVLGNLIDPKDCLAGISVLDTGERKIKWINLSKFPLNLFPRKLIVILLKSHGHVLQHFEITNPALQNWKELLPFLSANSLACLTIPRKGNFEKNEEEQLIDRIAGFTQLTSLNISLKRSRSDQKNFGKLSSLTRLTDLNISGLEVHPVLQLNSIAALTNLTCLAAEINTITFESYSNNIAQLPLLKKLSLADCFQNEFSLSIIGGMTTLKELNLNGARICRTDVSPLYNLTNLTVLLMEGNDISEEAHHHFSSVPGLKFTNSPAQVGRVGYVHAEPLYHEYIEP